MLPFSSTLSSQIGFLLQTLNDSNYESVLHELCQLAEYGVECSILLLQTCLDQVNIHEGDMQNMQLKSNLLTAIFRYLLDKPNISTVFCGSLRSTMMNEGFLGDLSIALHFSTSEKIGLGLALSDSEDLDLRTKGQNFCMAQIEELCANPSVVSHDQIQNILVFLYRSDGLSQHVDAFVRMLSLLQEKEKTPLVLAPMLMNDLCEVNPLRNLDSYADCDEHDFDSMVAEIEKEMSMVDIMKELGYGCTVNGSSCKELLSLFSPLDEVTISRIISTIVRTRTGLDDTQSTYATFCSALGSSSLSDSSSPSSWNVDVLLDSIKQLAPETNWKIVMENLDHEGFYVPDEESFSLFMTIYADACQDQFPLHAVCGSVWNNTEGQLSFLKYAVSAPPEKFTFSHSPRQLSFIESVQGNKLPYGGGNQAWTCLDLLEVLCNLAEKGHVSTVQTLLEYPLKHCPEVLLIGIAHINTAFDFLQYEVLSIVFPLIVGNAMKSDVIHQLWRVNPNLVLRGFVDVSNADPENISRILNICTELKIFSTVLDMAPFSFGIKLAAFASRKEHLNLEKWLSENLSMYKDAFFEECLKFLKEVSIDLASDGPTNPFQNSGAFGNVISETSSTFFKVLQAHSGQLLSHQLADDLKRLHATTIHVNSRLQSAGAVDSSASDGFPDDIEATANSFFDQIFSGELTMEAAIKMLAHFKGSSDKREQGIFECVIRNLFDEYKFLHRYPERQLKITAVLFGSLIKHQLVYHLALGCALRCVLDALRKSVDSKMFMFGSKALEQFTERLVEWPQYCNHILQISHLRGTHAELMAFIERSLARISSSQSEPNGGRGTPTDQSQSSTAQATVENTEVSEASWQLMGSTSTASGQQLSSPVQIQQRHQGLLEDRQKTSATSVSYIKPLLNPSGQSSASTQFDLVTNQKSSGALSLQNVSSQQASSGSGPGPNPGFLRPTRALTPAGMPRQQAYNTGFGAALNIETLVAAAERRDAAIEAPASEIQDRILFMINNISAANIEAKAKEFTEILKEHYYPWFAQYMVMKRASIEPNFHDLYLKFLDKVNSKALNKEIVKATYENCKVLLRSELIKSSSEERSLLKNLGSWLGKFTIGRNQALRAREIDPKVLIMEAYEKGLMIAVIPFTSKILEPCQCSMAYQPPNPWTMGILGLLSEIYNLPNLKMNLKFDIEVLYKNLGVDMKDVKPTSLLKDRVREIEGNPDFSNKDLGLSHQQMVTDINPGLVSSLSQAELQPEGANHALSGGHANILNQYTAPIHLVSSTLSEDEKLGPLSLSERLSSGQGLPQVAPSQSPFSISQLPTPLPNIGTHVVVNQKLNALGLNLQFQRILTMAMERAIREVITPVIERSITIACMTTKELVLKDYAMESDESRIHHSANLMVASLAGSLAHVTCKEPLRHSMSNHLRSSLQALNVTSEFLEQAIQLVTNDNLDLGCAVVEQAATEKALQNIDEVIAHMLSIRRKQRDGLNSTFFDASTYAQGTLARLPEALRPKPGRLSIAQQRVYEDFVRFPWQNQTSQSSNTVPGGPSGGSGLSRVYNSSLGQLNPNIYSAAQLAAGFSNAAQPLDQISGEIDAGSIPLSVSSSHVGATDDGVLQHGVENVIPSLTQTFTGTEVHTEESPSIKDSGAAVVQPSISASVTEREPLLTTGDALDMYETVAQKLENLISKDARDSEIQGVIAEVPEIVLRCVSRDEAALAIAQKVFKSLYENTSNSTHVGSHLAILVAIRDVCKLVVKELTSWVVYSDEERKFNKDITVGLIRSELLNLAEYNVHIAKLIDAGRNKAATEFAISLVKTSVDQESGVSVSEVYNLFDALAKLAMRPGSPESLQQLVETARNLSSGAVAQSGFATGKDDKARQFRDKKVTPGRVVTGRDDSTLTSADSGASDARDQASLLLAEWLRICEYNGTSDTVLAPYIAHLQQSGMLKGDDHMDRLFRLLTEFSVSHCLPSSEANTLVPMSLQAPQQLQNLSFNAIDMYAKLVVLVVKYCAVDQGSNKISLLPKILSVTVRVIQKDAEEKKFAFNSRPYFRLFINWLLDICSPDPTLDATNFQVLTAFANAFHALQPLKVPAFSFSWLELVSHRSFMPKLLVINSQKGWPFVQRLLVDLFKFMEPYLRNAELGEPVHFLYKGTLRVLLVLLHDFPEFLCDYHFSFCDVIPPSCIQMRNVILSAFPRNMRLPDPFTPNLKVDLLPEITQSPRILSEVDGALKVKQMKADIDEYLKTRQPGSTFLAELKQRLMLPQAEATLTGTKYNVPLINSLVLYVGMQAIQQLQSKSTPQQLAVPTPPMTHSAPMDIFQKLIIDLDTEGRYLFLNAVANQLRYPNNHTHYFSCVLLFLFAEANQDIIQEQITRVLLERLIVNRPHPWGLLITFIELIKNPRYSFWSRSFTHCAPEIEKLFESVARSCGGPGMKATEDGDGAH